VKVNLKSIVMDKSICCRAKLNIEAINDYAEAMLAGGEFPPVDLFGTDKECWIGDGWHRVSAADNAALRVIEANLHQGGRSEAVKFALNCNAAHGVRRTNVDKHRCVEIALREFSDWSNVAVAEVCAVSVNTVRSYRDQLVKMTGTTQPARGKEDAGGPKRKTRTGRDGKQHPAEGKRSRKNKAKAKREEARRLKAIGIDRAREAIAMMATVPLDDPERAEGWAILRGWLDENEG
jgi:hypothetical protein